DADADGARSTPTTKPSSLGSMHIRAPSIVGPTTSSFSAASKNSTVSVAASATPKGVPPPTPITMKLPLPPKRAHSQSAADKTTPATAPQPALTPSSASHNYEGDRTAQKKEKKEKKEKK